MADCLHCDINQLVHEHIERGNDDLGEIAAMMVESTATMMAAKAAVKPVY